jgi:hypothetical protein
VCSRSGLALVAAALLAAVGCGADGGDDGVQPPAELRGECAASTRWGGFLVEASEDFSAVSGSVSDGVVAALVPELAERAGECTLLRRRSNFCEIPCVAGMTCDEAGQCVPLPAQLDIGTVVVDGLAKPVSMMPIEPGSTYFDTNLPHPGFAPAAPIALSAGGGDVGQVALFGVGSDLLEVAGEAWMIRSGEPLEIAWSAPTSEGLPTQALLELMVDQHGISPLLLRCGFADTGSATVSGQLTKTLVEAGVSGFPNGSLTRRTADSQPAGDGCIDLVVGSRREHPVRLAGHTPCTTDEQCPAGQSCDQQRQTCQ